MLGRHGRGLTKALFTAPALALARLGVTPNMLTVTGTVVTVGIAALTIPQGRFVLGPVLLTISLVADSFDGILARATGRSSQFGAFLDSTMDRLADGAVYGCLALWVGLHMAPGTLRTWTLVLAISLVVLAATVPYARARAESIGTSAAVGIAERSDRLIAIGVCVLAVGLGAPVWVITVGTGVVVAAALITVVQRVLAVYHQLSEREAAA